MPVPRLYRTEVIILKSLKFSEADRILTLYTSQKGKIKAIAKGVSRPKSKLRGHVEPLTHSDFMLSPGTNLDLVSQGQTINSFFALRDDLWKTSCGLYAAELVNQFTPERQENPALFELLLNFLKTLCTVPHEEIMIRHFELHLLDNCGYRPQLIDCIRCETPLEPTTNYFSSNGGGMLCPHCQYKESLAYPVSLNALKVLRFLQNNDALTVTRLITTPRLLQELEQLTRHYIRYLLERETGSAKWLDEVRTMLQREKA